MVKVDVDAFSLPMTTGAMGFGVPAAAKFDSRGRLHVVDNVTGEVVRVDTATGPKQILATLSPGLDNLAFDSRDRLFVSSAQDGGIIRLIGSETDGRLIVPNQISRAGMTSPGGVAVMPENQVFVADTLSLREFDERTGQQLSQARDALVVPGTVAAPLQ